MENIKNLTKKSYETKLTLIKVKKEEEDKEIEELFERTYKELEAFVSDPNNITNEFKTNLIVRNKITASVRNKFDKLGYKTKDEPCYCSGPCCGCADFIIDTNQFLK